MAHIGFGRWLGDPQDLGKGTSADPYRIYTPQQLYSVRNDLQGSYKLMADLDMTDWSTDIWAINDGSYPTLQWQA